METIIVPFSTTISSAIDLVMVAVIAVGSIVTLSALILGLIKGQHLPAHIHEIWMRYAAWILLALEFALAADLIDTVIAPNWQAIGQFGAIAAIRVVLGYFLGRDISEYGESSWPDQIVPSGIKARQSSTPPDLDLGRNHNRDG